METKNEINVIIAGVGGQGNVLASQILGQLFVEQGYKVTIGETYGVSQRGGSVMSHLRLSGNEQVSPIIPKGLGDLIVALEPMEGLRILGQFGNPDVQVIVNTRTLMPMSVMAGETQYPDINSVLQLIQTNSKSMWTVDATQIALDMGNSILSNIIMLGAVAATNILPIDQDKLFNVFARTFPPKYVELNRKAFENGMESLSSRT
ncbi:MAG: indolepyruvate oxidoreductase subunit beta [Thermodesulfobacteriota bacterium]